MKESQSTEKEGEKHALRLRGIARLRVIVGYLGEKAQHNWWPSEFLLPTAPAFLAPVFGKTAVLAQYHGVKEAARRVHDDHIGVGRVFHLFRLPESVEQAVFDVLQDPEVTAALRKSIESADTASGALQGFMDSPGALQEGPVQIGTVSELDGSRWLSDVARCYHAAFSAGLHSFPYLVDEA